VSGRPAVAAVRRALVLVLVGPIRLYRRFISPLRPPTCRFYPSCSSYAVTAIEVHGVVVGPYLAIRRLLRCHPWTPGGIDQVPPKDRWREIRPPYDPDEERDSVDSTGTTRSSRSSADPSSLTPRPKSSGPTTGPEPMRPQGA